MFGIAAFAAVPYLNRTRTATGLLLLLPLVLLLVFLRSPRAAVIGAGTLAAVVFAGVLFLAATYDAENPRTGRLDRLVDATLSERRPQLWHDAASFALRNPITGVGPGRYPEVSAVSRIDRETKWPHNEFLHVAVEAGLPAMLLLLGTAASGFVMLWYGPDPRAAAVGAFTLGAVIIHGSLDFVLHYPAVPVAAAALVAAAIGPAEQVRELRSRSRSRNGFKSGSGAV
jgi:O-antigen ligase